LAPQFASAGLLKKKQLLALDHAVSAVSVDSFIAAFVQLSLVVLVNLPQLLCYPSRPSLSFVLFKSLFSLLQWHVCLRMHLLLLSLLCISLKLDF